MSYNEIEKKIPQRPSTDPDTNTTITHFFRMLVLHRVLSFSKEKKTDTTELNYYLVQNFKQKMKRYINQKGSENERP